MVRQLRESVGLGVDAIAMMGHPGNEALMPLAKQAAENGIIMTYQNVDPGEVRAKYGGGYVGANLATQGKALAREAIRQFGFKAGDHAIVMVPLGDYARAQREDGARLVFEEHGMTVTVLDGDPKYASDPNMTIPIFGAALNANPETKVIVHSGSDIMNVAEGIAKAAGYEPNDLLQIGFDTSPQIMSAFEKGYVHLTSDQQPPLKHKCV
jgi:simple sugar transport system substrate-binding protein